MIILRQRDFSKYKSPINPRIRKEELDKLQDFAKTFHVKGKSKSAIEKNIIRKGNFDKNKAQNLVNAKKDFHIKHPTGGNPQKAERLSNTDFYNLKRGFA